MDKLMNEVIRVRRNFDEEHGLPFDEEEKRMLWALLEMAVETGQIRLPDRHPGAVKQKQLILTFSRVDTKDWQLNMPISEVELLVTEGKRFHGF
jgi:hypothetical protein